MERAQWLHFVQRAQNGTDTLAVSQPNIFSSSPGDQHKGGLSGLLAHLPLSSPASVLGKTGRALLPS